MTNPKTMLANELAIAGHIRIEHGRLLTTAEKASVVSALRTASERLATWTGEPANGDVVTVKVPDGYDSVWDFLNDCGLEAVSTPTALRTASERLAASDENIPHSSVVGHGPFHHVTQHEKNGCEVCNPPQRLAAGTGERAHQAALNNLREAWSALAMIRETVETLAPSGSVQASEHLEGPTFMHEADALVKGILALSTPMQQKPLGDMRL